MISAAVEPVDDGVSPPPADEPAVDRHGDDERDRERGGQRPRTAGR